MNHRPVVPVFGRSVHSAVNQSADFSDLPWQRYWDDSVDISINQHDTFRVYTAGFKRTNDAAANPSSVLLLLHGGGQSSLSWSLCAARMKDTVKIIAIDLRGHGCTKTSNDNDLSADTAIQDLTQVTNHFFNPSNNPSLRLPSIAVCGHSLGGALAIRLAAKHTSQKSVAPSPHQLVNLPVSACICVDMCEDTALENIRSIKAAVSTRPDYFQSLDDAVEWSLRIGMIRNVESARVSIPAQLVPQTINQSISQSLNESYDQSHDEDVSIGHHFIWRTDLLGSERHWLGWFTGLSDLFLSISQPKLLILADVERLDRAMSIAHMQGKIQVAILASTGHQIMEDQPSATASTILQFWQRHQLGVDRLRSIAALNQAFANCK